MSVATIGLDLAKSVFQFHGVDDRGSLVLKRRVSEVPFRLSICHFTALHHPERHGSLALKAMLAAFSGSDEEDQAK